MAAGTKIQLRLGDRVVAEVAFRDGELRIGRMKENELVINNLAVSRFHAVLRRVGEAYEIEDLGSENGTYVAGTPVRGTAQVPPGAPISIGKHVLTILAGGEGEPQLPRTGRSDAWDAAQTYFAPELAPRGSAVSAAELSEALVDDADDEDALVAEVVEEGAAAGRGAAPETVRPPAASLDLPDPEGRFAFGEEDLVVGPGPDPGPILLPAAEFDISASESGAGASGPQTSAERGGETALFDFAASDDLGLSEPSLARALVGRPGERPAQAPAPAETLYAGLIVQRGGKVERVVPFSGTELIVGRGPTCDLVLSTAGISRRHARFVREGESLRVLDLGSANGLRVHGERVAEHVLQLGDVVGIDDYALTFVLDREPLDQAVRSASVATAAGSGGHRTVLHSAPFASMPERDLVTESDEEDHPADVEKELEIVAALVGSAASGLAQGAGGNMVVELVLGGESLPAALRSLLRELGTQELRLPVELRIRRRS
jgi:pSer/pThr/pTyr-binding forkhead associated (FHA) protein